jgi:hypothetical protein
MHYLVNNFSMFVNL